MRVPGGEASCLGVGRPGTGALPPPTSRPFGRAAGAHYPLAVGTGGAGVGTRHQSHSARSCLLWGRHEGAPGGRLLPGCGASRDGRSPTPDHLSFRACGRGPPPTGTLSRAAVRCVLGALPGFAAPGGRCGLAPVLVPWLWPAACLSGVPRGPALVRRSSSGLVTLGAPVGFPVAVVPFPTPGAIAPGSTGSLRGARGGRPRTGLIVSAAGPCRGKGTGRARRSTRSGPRDGVVSGWSLRLRSWAACAAVIWCVWTRSLTRPVSCTVCLATGDSAGAPGLFRVDADTAPARVCVCVPCLVGSGGPASWVRSGAPHLSFGHSWCALCLFGSLRAGVAPFVVVVGFFFSLPFPPSLRPRCVLLCVFSGFGCLGPWRLVAPPPPTPFFPPPPPLCTPLSPGEQGGANGQTRDRGLRAKKRQKQQRRVTRRGKGTSNGGRGGQEEETTTGPEESTPPKRKGTGRERTVLVARASPRQDADPVGPRQRVAGGPVG